MTVNEINDAPILDQLRGKYEKFLALVVWKLAPGGVRITAEDMIKFQAEGGLFFVHGHFDSIDFKIVTPEEAKRLAEHQKAQVGRA